MDTRTQLDAERERLEAELLALEQEGQALMPPDGDPLVQRLRVESLLSSLSLVNLRLAAIRHRDENGLRP